MLALEAVETTRAQDGTVLPEAEEALHRAVQASSGRPAGSGPRRMRSTGAPTARGSSPRGRRTQGSSTSATPRRASRSARSTVTTSTSTAWRSAPTARCSPRRATTAPPRLGPDDRRHARGDRRPRRRCSGPRSARTAPWWPPRGSSTARSGCWTVRSGEVLREIDACRGRSRRRSARTGTPRHRIADSSPPPSSTSLPAETVFTASGTGLRDQRRRLEPRRQVARDLGPTERSRSGRPIPARRSSRLGDRRRGHQRRLDRRFAPAGHRAGATGSQGVGDLRERRARAAVVRRPGHPSGITGVAFSPDGDRVLTGDIEITAARIWDVSTRAAPNGRTSGLGDAWNSVAFPATGTCSPATPGGAVRVWDAETGRRIRDLPGQRTPDRRHIDDDIEPSPDGKFVAAVVSGDVEVSGVGPAGALHGPGRRLRTGRLMEPGRPPACDRRPGHRIHADRRPDRQAGGGPQEAAGVGPSAVAFSPDGRLLATAVWPIDRPDPSSERMLIWDWKRNGTRFARSSASRGHGVRPGGRPSRRGRAGRGRDPSAARGSRRELAGGAEGLERHRLFAGRLARRRGRDRWGRPGVGHRDGRADAGARPRRARHGRGLQPRRTQARLGGRRRPDPGVGARPRRPGRIARAKKLTRKLTPGECRQFLHRACPAAPAEQTK